MIRGINFFLFVNLISIKILMCCTIGILKDEDEKPIIFKNRDKAWTYNDGEIYLHRPNRIYKELGDKNYIAVSSGDFSNPYMGLNEDGFGIVNSIVDENNENNLRDDVYKTVDLFKEALNTCSTIDDFASLLGTLDITNTDDGGIIDIKSIFAVSDLDDAAIFEIFISNDGIDSINVFEEFNLEPENNSIVRTNHFLGILSEYNPLLDTDAGTFLRYDKAYEMIDNIQVPLDLFRYNLNNPDLLELPLLRNLSKSDGNNYQIPYQKAINKDRAYGYLQSNKSINRSKTVSSVIISNEIMWTNIGNPIISPYFPIKVSDSIPFLLEGEVDYSQFSELVNEIKEEMFDYSSIYDYNNYLDSYLLLGENHNGIVNIVDNIESDLVIEYLDPAFNLEDHVTNAYDILSIYKNDLLNSFQEQVCEIGEQIFDGQLMYIDATKHYPKSNAWVITDGNGLVLLDTISVDLFFPSIDYPIEGIFPLTIEHSIGDINLNIIDSCIAKEGDYNNDLQIDIADILLLVQYVLGTMEPILFLMADVNDDESINIRDIVLLIEYILSIE